MDINKPFMGAIMVIQKYSSKKPKANNCHVTFVVGRKKTKITQSIFDANKRTFIHLNFKVGDIVTEYLGLGGNQDNRVNLTYYGFRHRILGFVKPKGYNPCEEHKKLDDNWYTRWAACHPSRSGGSTS